MKPILELISAEVKSAFKECGFDANFGEVSISNRPDLCQYQCNGALAAAKEYKKAPFMIADDVVNKLTGNAMFQVVTMVRPGFINITLSPSFLADYLNDMKQNEEYGIEKTKAPKTIVIDYGGPNVAKPLHVGHLRPAIIGESIKRINRIKGHNVIGDVHLGDWGLPIGLIISELKRRKPELCYFDEQYEGEYPAEAPFTISELEEIYPAASAYSKENNEFRDAAKEVTRLVQEGHKAYRALWKHILEVSVTDLKKNYEKLNVHFDLWKGESDADAYIPEVVAQLKEKGLATVSEGALVVDVKEETDTKEVPPCLILKSDGSALYATTDIATIYEREKLFQPDEIKYIVDKRQDLHFLQVFRTCRLARFIKDEAQLTFLGFGTMNGKDGKPFKTRDGGVMRLENLIGSINEEVYKKIMENREMSEEEAKNISQIVGLAALKYGDLSNQATKDYIFDIERFASFEGNTGPYILYTIVRIKSILAKCAEQNLTASQALLPPKSDSELDLMLELTKFNAMIDTACEEDAPHKVCQFIYDISNAFNRFYHDNKILTNEDKERQASYIALITLVKEILSLCIDLLGLTAPDRM